MPWVLQLGASERNALMRKQKLSETDADDLKVTCTRTGVRMALVRARWATQRGSVAVPPTQRSS